MFPGVLVAGPLDSVKLFWFSSRNVTADPVFFVKLVWLAGCAEKHPAHTQTIRIHKVNMTCLCVCGMFFCLCV